MSPRRLPLLLLSALLAGAASAQINTVQAVAPGVYFHEGDPRRGHCNNGWVILDDYVVVIDGNFPSGAQVVMPKVTELTPKPVRFVVDTHHHGDHAYGNQLWADAGATIVAHAGAFQLLQTAGPAAWADAARNRPDVAASKLRLPSLIFPDTLVFDDGRQRIELHWFGVGHTRGDTFLWLPQQKILFTGDACVNGPHNYMRDGDTAEWIKALEKAKQLGAEIVCPGHGPRGGPEVLADQQAYLIELRRAVQVLVAANRTLDEARGAVSDIAAALKQNPRIARYVPSNARAHVEKAYADLTAEAGKR